MKWFKAKRKQCGSLLSGFGKPVTCELPRGHAASHRSGNPNGRPYWSWESDGKGSYFVLEGRS